MKIGVFVGSFNPVHNGHINLQKELLERKYVDKIYIIPTGNYWNKKDLAPLEHRFNMLKYFETENTIVSTKYSNLKYTYEILNELKKNSKDEFYLIIGADNLLKFHLWKNVDSILENKVIVINRNHISCLKYINKFKNKENLIIVNDIDEINVSSTEIRKNKEYRNRYLDEKVLEYIDKNNLYWRSKWKKK